ncbi:MAG TPA: carboxypeptidase-like regulatory domain-containing protein [Lacipirellulaceae bacterium]
MPLQVTVVADGYDRETVRRVVAAADADAKAVEFRLKPLGSLGETQIRGLLVDSDSKPVAGAEVRLIVAETRTFPRDRYPFNWQMIRSGQVQSTGEVSQFLTATTDRDGAFSFDHVRGGADLELAYWGEGVSQARREHLEKLSEADRQNLRIAVVAPGVVRGTIDRESFPSVSNVMLMPTGGTGGFDASSAEISSDTTKYEIRNVPPGSYELQVYGDSTRPEGGPPDSIANKVLHRRAIAVRSGETVTYDIAAGDKPVEAPKHSANDGVPKANDGSARTASRSLSLTVLDGDDHPVPAANVTVRIRQVIMGPWQVTHEHCDENGQLQVDLPSTTPTYLAIRAELPGYAPFWAEWEQRETTDPIPDSYVMHLDPGQTIGGIVQDDQGHAIRDAKVNPRFIFKMRPEKTYPLGFGDELTTDADGRWSYSSFPKDVQQVTISVKHPDYAATRVSELTSKFVIASGGAPSQVLTMKPGIVIGGKVSDENGDAVTGATVIYHSRQFGSDPPQNKTKDDGTFHFANGEEGEAFLTASADDWAPSIQNVQIEPAMGPVEIKLTRGAPLRIRVVDSSGTPLEGVWLSLWSWQENEMIGTLAEARGTTDATGVWTWPHAPNGPLGFAVSKTGFTYIREANVSAGDQENVVTMQVESPERTHGLSIAGRVTDSQTKEPIARFRVTPGEQRNENGPIYWYHENQSDGRDGQYRKDFTPQLFGPAYAHILRVEADGYVPATSRSVTEKSGAITVDFEMQKGGGAEWLVLTPQGQAAKDATVAICTPGLGPSIQDGMISPNSTCERASTDGDGRFSIAPQTEKYALMVVHESGAAYATQDQVATAKTVQLEPWARVEGVVKIRNQPAANEQVTIQRDETIQPGMPRIHYEYRTTTDKDGNFAFDRVVPGPGLVCRNAVTDTGGGMSSWTPTLTSKTNFAAGQTTHVVLSRDGRPVTAKLVVPKELEDKNDWRLAMANLQERPRNLPAAPKIPWPKEIDPAKDREAAMKWANEWKDTEEGKQFLDAQQTYVKAMSAIKPVFYATHVQSDGALRFDDIPAGDYQLTVQALARPAGGGIGPGDVIATLTQTFTVPGMPGGRSDEPLDLGQLTLEKLQRPKAQAGKAAPMEDHSKADGSATHIGTSGPPNDADATKSSRAAPQDAVKIVGTVTDNEGKVVEGARLWLPARFDAEEEGKYTVTAVTSSDGSFALDVPTEFLAPGDFTPGWTIWCYAPGYRIATASAYQTLKRKSAEPVVIKLLPEADTAFVVTDPMGHAVAGARVEPWHYLTAAAYEIVPAPLRKLAGGTTDEQGRAALPAVGRDGFFQVRIETAAYGIQNLRLVDKDSEPAERSIELRETGRIDGELISGDREAIQNVRVYAYQEDFMGQHTAGEATTRTDRDGKFSIEHFAEGPVHLGIAVDKSLPLRPRVPERVEVNAGKTTRIAVPLEAAVRVRGLVRTKSDHTPVPGAQVSVQYGAFQQGGLALTDSDGRFEVFVLPGQVQQQLIMQPDEFSRWTEEKAGWEQQIQVSGDRPEAELPPIEIVQTFGRSGRLVDQHDQPVANATISAIAGNRRFSVSNSVADGSFSLWLPETPAMDKYEVNVAHSEPIGEATVVQAEPLLLQINR